MTGGALRVIRQSSCVLAHPACGDPVVQQTGGRRAQARAVGGVHRAGVRQPTHQAGVAAAGAQGFETAIELGARRIVCADDDFTVWPWDDVVTLDRLTAWLRLPQRSLLLLARDFDAVPRAHPRFNAWRRDWAHAITGRQVPADWVHELPTLLVADKAVSVRLMDRVHWRGRAQSDERAAHLLRVSIDVVLQRSEAAFAVSPLGL